MEIKGIDVSAYQGSIDYSKVAHSGIQYVILRITEKGNKTDPTFDPNYKGFTSAGFSVGVYKFSYALSVEEAKEEAHTVLQVLQKRKLDLPVFYDMEWSNQRTLSKSTLTRIIQTFRQPIVDAGYKFGIYCNSDWYKNVLDVSALPYDYWIAAYPASDTGIIVERLRPDFGIGWQYSSKGRVPGISGNVDRSVFCKDYNNKNGGVEMATINDTKKALITAAYAEVGYLEKKSDAYLDDMTKNAGYNNYTKYWRDVMPSYQTQPWCAAFVTWCFDKVFGKNNTKKLLKHYPYVYCPTLGELFTKYANPEVGDIVIFWRNGTFAHTGIVTKVDGDRFQTVEGNTSSGSAIVPNGGGVYEKSYYNTNLPGTKFCRIDWDYAASVYRKPDRDWIQLGDTGNDVKQLQNMLNKLGFDCGQADGEFGKNTENAVRRFQTAYLLDVDGQYGINSKKTLEAAYEAIISGLWMASDAKGLCIANTSLIGRVYPNGIHLKKILKGTWLHPYLKKKDVAGRWWFACKVDGITMWFSSTGFNGWIQDTVGWWYVLKGYKYYSSQWRRIRGLWYEFDASGYRKTSCWTTYKGRKRYLKADGVMANGETLVINGREYIFAEGGGVSDIDISAERKGE